MWFAIPTVGGWIELREGTKRPVKEVHEVDVGEGQHVDIITYRGGVCRGVVKSTHFTSKTGHACRQLKKISAKDAEEVLRK